ncbi:MAG: DUF5658 family protein [Gammaproteobacteria bacterium]
MSNSAGNPDACSAFLDSDDRLPACAVNDRRLSQDRREKTWWSLCYGGVRPRRRSHRRDADGFSGHTDWLDSELLYLTLGILVLCTADAIMTLNLLNMGAREANIFMAHMIEKNEFLFGATKMALTGLGLILLVMHAQFRLFRLIKVQNLLRIFFIAYCALIGYEIVLYRLI